MLRSFKTDSSFRALTLNPFEHEGSRCVLGRRTVIYGRNGSGKTTFSEILRLTSSGMPAEGVTATASVRTGGVNASIRLGAREFVWNVFVYNRYYVQDSLELFLDGSGDSPTILKLGAPNVAATREIARVRTAITDLEQRRQGLQIATKALLLERDAIEKSVKSEVISSLAASDPAKYNPTRFQITRARSLLLEPSAVQLSVQSLLHETSVAGAPVVEPVLAPTIWSKLPTQLKDTINNELLAIQVDSDSISRLTASSALANWVEEGVGLHRQDDLCKFCQQGTVTAEILAEYARHFSAALDALRSRLEKARVYLSETANAAAQYIQNLPTVDSLLIDHRAAIEPELTELTQRAEKTQAHAMEAIMLLEKRLADPLKPLPDERLLSEEFPVVDSNNLTRLMQRHNDACSRQAERKAQAQAAVEEHFGAVQGLAYKRCIHRLSVGARALLTLNRRETTLENRVAGLVQLQEDTGRMAIEIDKDLREHFGHGHLSITVSDDRKGYRVQRSLRAAKGLSEGERNAIAFSYFLRSLEAEGVDPKKTLVVIDDPVTSMDKESLFAGFALAEERTQKFAQVVILTHDYEYFRLQLGQRASARRDSEKKILDNNADELAFPAVAILEIAAKVDPASGDRTSSIRKLPPSLLRHPSEYHYLFAKVAEAVRDGDHETLPLLGNAARRLLEGFISFRAPSGDNFQQKIDFIKRTSSVDDVLARGVVKFMHGQSHREEPRPAASLDFPSIEVELRAALNFMRQADAPHFGEMCRSVAIAESALTSNMP